MFAPGTTKVGNLKVLSPSSMIGVTYDLYEGANVVSSDAAHAKTDLFPTSHIHIDNSSVSSMHALIDVSTTENIYVIRDLKSTSGTFMSKTRVTLSSQLPLLPFIMSNVHPNGIIKFGDVECQCSIFYQRLHTLYSRINPEKVRVIV